MHLTGRPLVLLMAASAVVALVVCVAVLPRLTGRGLRSAVSRGLVLIGFAAVCLLTGALALNSSFGFFGSWRDLAGAILPAPSPGPHIDSPASTSVQTVDPATVAATPAPQQLPLHPVGGEQGPDNRSLVFQVTGRSSGLTGQVVVALPAGYDDPANANRTYPVIEAFHGYPGHATQWVYEMGIDTALQSAVSGGLVAPAIVVSPALSFPDGVDTECVDGPGGDPKVETWLAKDIPQWIVENLRVRTDRSTWVTMGLSSGGWCAAMAAMLHPDQYSAAVVMGGYFRPQFSGNYRPFASNEPAAARYDLVRLGRDAPPPVAMWIQTSKEDQVSYRPSAEFIGAAQAPMSVTVDMLDHGGHRFDIWQKELPAALAWLGSTVPGFAPKQG